MSARTDIHPWYINFNSLSQAFWMATRFQLISTSPLSHHEFCIQAAFIHLFTSKRGKAHDVRELGDS